MERLEPAGLVGGAINNEESDDGVGTVVYCDRGLECGGERAIETR